MVYQKNVPVWERIIRIIIGLVFVGAAVAGETVFGGQSNFVTLLLLFSALFIVITGFVGWCPACWLFGRKLKNKS